MKKFVAFSVLALACVSLLWIPRAHTAANDEAEIRQLLDRWTKAFRSRDLKGIMSIYEPGQILVAYDIVPPLQYTGFDAYKKDYQEFLDQFQGAMDIEVRDLSIIVGDTVAFSRGLERMSGTLKNGEKFDAWVRFTECYRKINGHWLAIHDHISVPVDLNSGKAVLDLKP
jgi:ketosteroid isomerase-like protein